GEVGVVLAVVDDPAGIHRLHAPVRQRHVDGVGVAADTGVLLEQGDAVMARQAPGAGQPGNAGTDDRDIHGREFGKWMPVITAPPPFWMPRPAAAADVARRRRATAAVPPPWDGCRRPGRPCCW